MLFNSGHIMCALCTGKHGTHMHREEVYCVEIVFGSSRAKSDLLPGRTDFLESVAPGLNILSSVWCANLDPGVSFLA